MKKKKEMVIKKSSNTTRAISLLIPAHDLWLYHQLCRCSSVLLNPPLKLPMSLATRQKPYHGGRGEAQAALYLLAGLSTALLHYAFHCLLYKTTFSSPKLS